MLVGQDFPKITFEFMGYQLLEPNAFIGDLLLFLVSMYLLVATRSLQKETPFFKNWKRFYLVFGISFLLGGFGHLLYNYWGLWGRYLPWLLGIVATFFAERAMVSIYPAKSRIPLYNRIINLKLVLSLIAELLVFSLGDLESNQQLGLMVPTISSVIGLGTALGVLGYYYSKVINPCFRYLWWSTLILIPSAFFQALKINIHPWFDRSDVSHLLLIVSIVLYFQTIKRYARITVSE